MAQAVEVKGQPFDDTMVLSDVVVKPLRGQRFWICMELVTLCFDQLVSQESTTGDISRCLENNFHVGPTYSLEEK